MTKVIVGMSGGVDSAVAAYLLKKAGYEVEGLFMRNWDSLVNNDINGNPNLNEVICPQEQDYNDAKEACKILNIPLHRIDFIKEYWDFVFKYFLAELEKGRTPNPDLLCNRFIKFDLFKKEAKRLGADFMATGHYAQVKNNKLYRGIDQNKDQSYFLAMIKKEQLKDVLFPVGNLKKEKVREIARSINLNVAKKKDSTGICFIGERNYQEFIKNYLKPNPGKIVNVSNMKEIGIHNGLMNYTIGQRRNVGISGFNERHYVCGKDVKNNILYVAFGDSEYLYSDECLIEDVNFISDERPLKCLAKFRYRGEDVEVSLKYIDSKHIKVYYPKRTKSVTPGQACVLYLDDECLGCGIIKEVYKKGEKLFYL